MVIQRSKLGGISLATRNLLRTSMVLLLLIELYSGLECYLHLAILHVFCLAVAHVEVKVALIMTYFGKLGLLIVLNS